MSGALTLAVEQLKARRKIALVLLALVAMLAAAAVTSGVSVLGSAGDRVDQLYEQTGRPDVFLSAGSVEQFYTILIDREGVDDLGVPYPIVGATVSRPGQSGVGLRLAAVDDPAAIGVGAPVLRSGRWATAPGEFVMDAAWAADTGASIGDIVEIEIDGLEYVMNPVGTAVDLGDCFYPNCDPVSGFVSTSGFDSIATASAFRGYASLAPGVGDEQVAGAIVAERPGVGMGTWSDTRADMVVSAEISSYFVSGLGVFVMFAAALVVASTAVAVVAARRREIALLKAMGSTPSQVAGSIVGEHRRPGGRGRLDTGFDPRSGSRGRSGRRPRAFGTDAGEAMAAFGFMDRYGYSVGDTVAVTFAERTFDVELVGRHADAEDTGRIMVISAATFHEAGVVWDLPMWRVSVFDGADAFEVGDRLTTELAADTNIFVLEPDLEAADFVRVVLMILTTVIILVALGNLAATMSSTARERERRTGVLRSLGFSSRQMLGQTAIAGAVIGALAAIVGISLGFLVSRLLLSVIMNAVGIGPGLATVPILIPVVVLLPLCVAAGALVGLVASAPSLRTSTSDLLRAE